MSSPKPARSGLYKHYVSREQLRRHHPQLFVFPFRSCWSCPRRNLRNGITHLSTRMKFMMLQTDTAPRRFVDPTGVGFVSQLIAMAHLLRDARERNVLMGLGAGLLLVIGATAYGKSNLTPQSALLQRSLPQRSTRRFVSTWRFRVYRRSFAHSECCSDLAQSDGENEVARSVNAGLVHAVAYAGTRLSASRRRTNRREPGPADLRGCPSSSRTFNGPRRRPASSHNSAREFHRGSVGPLRGRHI